MAQNDSSSGSNRQQNNQNFRQNMPPMPDFVRPLGESRPGYRSNPFTPHTARPRQYEGHSQSEAPAHTQSANEQNLNEPRSKSQDGGALGKLSPAGILKMLGLGKTGIDNDIIIIIMIFLMISGEKSDDLLTLALIYIML